MLPMQLAAPAPTWERDVDVVVLGSGAAGLSAALAARPVRSVLVVTKDILSAGSTAWAQGGLAGVLAPDDSLEDHVRDTLAAGAGLCDEANVRTLVAEAPKALRYLMRLGAAFDASTRNKVIERALALLDEHYVFPDVAAKVSAAVRRSQASATTTTWASSISRRPCRSRPTGPKFTASSTRSCAAAKPSHPRGQPTRP